MPLLALEESETQEWRRARRDLRPRTKPLGQRYSDRENPPRFRSFFDESLTSICQEKQQACRNHHLLILPESRE